MARSWSAPRAGFETESVAERLCTCRRVRTVALSRNRGTNSQGKSAAVRAVRNLVAKATWTDPWQVCT
jgi:hypothetical protein